ncbi:hypothetical protein AJ80_05776 [Polytolypa hystricis UAMH7299]|uniref:J domain-containing protein n=1 Tax=Polytolypa hystricis (strain UAMH7299) TaxID=1447883 RepID=A0A2B7Y0N8_POLH7|nr:hypothetical protein AJ80_05776 [Polytolypa hystricis UAMH7299]
MRPSLLRLFVLAALVILVSAWSKEDYEIFRLREEIAQTEGQNVTFYDFIGIKSSASQTDLTKAYRKKSKLLHPDKAKRAFVASYAKPKQTPGQKRKPGVHVNKGPSDKEIRHAVKLATERYARLSTVADILKGSGRERYDHFMKNGFPRWKGTGYYYSRFRPGLGTVLLGLFLAFGGGGHYGALILGWKRQREFVDRYIKHARRAAWGDELGIKGVNLGEAGAAGTTTATPAAERSEEGPVHLNRRQKRMMDKENRKESKKGGKSSTRASGTSTPTEVVTSVVTSSGDRKRVVAENGKVLIVDSVGNVYLEEETEDGEKEEFLLDVNEIQRPTFRDTAVVRLPIWLFRKSLGRVLGSKAEQEAEDAEAE